MGWIRRGVIGLGVVLVAAGAGIGAIRVLMPSDKVAALAVAQFDQVTGRHLTIAGSVSPSIWPVLGVKTGAISVSNADWSDAGPMLQAEGLSIGVDLSALLGGQIKVTELVAERPQIILEQAADGRQNWVFGGSNGGTATADMPGATTPFTLARGAINGGTLRFIDHAAGTDVTVDDVQLAASLPDYEGQALLTLSGRVKGAALRADLGVAKFRGLYEGGASEISLKIQAGGASLGFDGSAGANPATASGALDLNLSDRAALAALAGIAPPALPKGLGASDLRLSGQITVGPDGAVTLGNGRLRLDGAELAVNGGLTMGPDRPSITAEITGTSLDITPAAGAAQTAPAAAAGWDKSPLDLSGMTAVDGRISLMLDHLGYGSLALDPLAVSVTLEGGRATVDLKQAGLWGGSVTGKVVANGRKGLALDGDLRAKDVAIDTMLTSVVGGKRLVGAANLSLSVEGAGGSVDALMNSLSGNGNLTMGSGAINGFDLGAMLQSMGASGIGADQSTVFDGLTGSFVVAKGNLKTDDLTLSAPLLNAVTKGRVGLGAQDLDLHLTATALAASDGTGGRSLPVVISGPWSGPTILPDLQAMAEQKLQDKAAKALGLEQGQSLEDAAKTKLEEKAAKALGKLLGGN